MATPVIIMAKLDPNPANVGDTVTIQVMATDVENVQQSETKMTNEFKTGEVSQ